MDMVLVDKKLFALVATALVFLIAGMAFAIPSVMITGAHDRYDYSAVDDNGVQVDGSAVVPAASAQGGTTASSADTGTKITYKTIEDRKDALGVHPVLLENADAHDPTYAELMSFLSTDDTVNNKYDNPNFTCANFASELQNHAEALGIQCGYASLKFYGKSDGHAVDVFNTIDRGPVYVDTTGGEDLITNGLYPGDRYHNLGVISQVTEYW
jgi:hypothetical protein